MTREEAKELLLHILMTYEPKDQYGDYNDTEPYEQALTMAIEALQTIDNCDQCEWCCPSDGIPTIHVVRCKDCKHYSVKGKTTQFGFCGYRHAGTDETDYCSRAVRRKK